MSISKRVLLILEVELRNISKRFGPVQAVDDVSVSIHSGEILGIVGENGAGKTTLMNILYGLYKPDAGSIFVNGQKVRISSPKDAINLGIFMVHQHFKLINNFTALENIILGTLGGFEQFKRQKLDNVREKITQLMREHGLEVPLDEKVKNLPVGVQQRIEILKALYREANLLILDEPTTNLTPQETEDLLKTTLTMKKKGMSVVLITHKIREIMEVVDRVVVLRRGKLVGEVLRKDLEPEKLVEMMVGRKVELESAVKSIVTEKAHEIKKLEQRVLEVSGLTVVEKGIQAVKNVSFHLNEGEVLGLAGVSGNGQKELCEALFGAIKVHSGKILFKGKDITHAPTPDRIKEGFRFIPEDRIRDGVLPTMSVAENLVLGYQKLRPYSQRGLLNYRILSERAKELIKSYAIRTPDEKEKAGKLSGGNIQKIMIARSLMEKPILLIAYNPTRGLDVASTEKVLLDIVSVKLSGGSVIFASEDLDELMLVSDRIIVMYKGEIVGELPREKFNKEEIGLYMMGLKR